jgi:hypothetical protein
MKPPLPPRLERRRTSDFAAELDARARAWIPAWAIADDATDFGRALLRIGARFDAEVAEQLDGAGAKLRDGLFDWLGVHGEAARPARVPVAFKLADKTVDPVLATAPSRLQASVDGASVVFETETDVQLVPSKLDCIVATEKDHVYLPPPGLASLEPVPPMPERWALKSFAAPATDKLQLDPDEGLVPGLVLRSGGQRFRVTAADKGLATIEPPLREGLAQGAIVQKVAQFAPFDGWNDEQVHALYFGSTDLFDITAEATLDILGAQGLAGVEWQYWGKRKEAGDPDAVTWQSLDRAEVQPYANALTLLKPEGAVEPREIAKGMGARWIRAVTPQFDQQPLGVDQLSVRINYAPSPPTCQNAAAKDSVGFEAMSNTTPLVVNQSFYPLGSAPRQFDAFYIGSTEAFSKKDALVQLCFELADLSFQNFASLRFPSRPGGPVLAGVTRGGGLQLLEFSPTFQRLVRLNNRQALHPPSPGLFGARVDDAPVTLRQGAIAIWERGSDVLVAAPSDDAVWLWRESDVPLFGFFLSGWTKLPDVTFAPPAAGQKPPPIDSLVFVSPYLIAVRGGTMFKCNPDDPVPSWTNVAATAGATPVEFTRLAPVLVAAPIPTIGARAVGVAQDRVLYALTFTGTPLKADCTALRTAVDPEITPAALLRVDNRLVAAAVRTTAAGHSMVGFQSNVGALTQQAVADAALGPGSVIGRAIDAGVANGRSVFALCLGATDGTSKVSRWSPFEAPLPDVPFGTPIPPGLGPAAGAPVVLTGQLVVPVLSSQVLVAPFDPLGCLTRQAPLRTAIITTPADPLQANDRVAFTVASALGFEVASASPPTQQGGETLFAYDVRAIDGPCFVYPAGVAATTSSVDTADLALVRIDAAHTVTPNQTRLLIATPNSTQTYLVVGVTAANVATLDRDLDVANPPPATIDYWMPAADPVPNDRNVRPLLQLNPATSGDWDSTLLDRILLALPGGDPAWQAGHAFQVDGNARPMLVDLAAPWVLPPPVAFGDVTFFVDAAVQAWTGQLADTTSNPALSWEYWNGTGWWNLNVTDRTQHLKRSGAITFNVPADLRPTDWSGKTSHWIRARLIGGDYGREEVTVVTSPASTPGATTQTIERNADGIRAPYVARLHVSYSMDTGVLPMFVLAQDSGSIRDQSDANRTPNAIVEAFVPLPLSLGRLSGTTVRADATTGCPEPCDCPGAGATSMGAQATAPSGPVAEYTGRALFLGFKGPLSGGPVRLYLRAKEPDGQLPRDALRVEALVADRFVPLVVEDDTRGLGESGMLTLVFDAEPTPRELFGTTLRWLRVTSSSNAAGWAPILQGAYLNAAWASATETMRYERLGSSEGAPDLVLNLARPPVLRDTLELRVLEPLGDEERANLREDDRTRVVNDLPELPGDWVRWEQVFDPADEAPDARAYALDEATGEIVFGDGEHGMIPSIGRDSIVAFRYQRTEPAADGSDRVPANAVVARTKLNLGSPVAGVEAVFAADQAAGGAPPEDALRILRFGGARLRHRNRAVGAPDLEDLALQSSPDIAQVRCFTSRGGVRLVVAMRGTNPTPSAAQRRELERLLRGVAPVTLGSLRIDGPTLREFGAQLQLRVQDLDDAGAVARAVRVRIAAWLDAVTGGADGQGWPLGRSPDASDIALALVDTPRLAGLLDVELHEIVDGVRERPWPASLRASDLALLRDDALHLAFSTAGEVA